MIFFLNGCITNILPLTIAIESHIARVIEALSSEKWVLNILTVCTVNVRKGILYIPAAPPNLLTDALTHSSHSFP